MSDAGGTVLITGDAGAIGSATVAVFLESGWSVLGVDTAERQPSTRHRYVTVTADVTDEADMDEAVRPLERMPPLRHVVAIAGGALPTEPKTQDDPADVDIDDFRASLELNLTSQFVTIRAALARLAPIESGDRSVTLTSSFNALSAQGMPGYSAAKAGLIGMMNALVRPLGRRGVRINTVAPGTIRTPRTERIWSHVPEHFEELGRTAALGHVGEPSDVARLFRAIALEMTHVTGQVIVVDGGQMAHP
jgi:NAD(P)-dependent dehydrogenase (short-subunit alcohol dehydrogenase family)